MMVSVNKKAFQPSIEAIKKKYYELYRGKGGAGEGDEGAAEMVMRRCARVRPAPHPQGRSRMKSEVKMCSSVCV